MRNYDYRLVIIGGGSGGLSAAELSHKLGLSRVALVEAEDRLGGECLHTGCVPSKALLHSAKQGDKDPWGHVRNSVKSIEERSDNDDHLISLGIDVIHGHATFRDKNTIEVNGQLISSKYFLISTGSTPLIPPIEGLKDVGAHTNETIFNLDRIPKRLAIIGAGPIGVEMATAFSALGSKVFLIQRGDRILASESEEAAAIIHESLESSGVDIILDNDNIKASKSPKGTILTLDQSRVTVDEVLISTGRKPTTSLDLENAGVDYTDKGISVDKYLRTSTKNIFAVGDCTPSPKFTHLASHQAGVSLGNMIAPYAKKSAERLVPTPAITYSWPEVGSLGMRYNDALLVSGSTDRLFDLHEIDRSITDRGARGFVRLVLDKKGLILHCTVVADNASELLTPLVLLHSQRRPITDLGKAVIPYPTVAHGLTLIASAFIGDKLRSTPGWSAVIRGWK